VTARPGFGAPRTVTGNTALMMYLHPSLGTYFLNTDDSAVYQWDGVKWQGLGGSGLVDKDTLLRRLAQEAQDRSAYAASGAGGGSSPGVRRTSGATLDPSINDPVLFTAPPAPGAPTYGGLDVPILRNGGGDSRSQSTAYNNGMDPNRQIAIDTFTRVVLPGGWGVGDLGDSWAPASAGSAGLSVNGARGLLSAGATSGFSLVRAGTADILTPLPAERTLRLIVRFGGVLGNPGNPNNYQTLIGLEDSNNGPLTEIFVRTNGPSAGPILSLSGGGIGVYPGIVIPTGLIATGIDYILVFQTLYTTGHYGIKFYPIGNPEPSTWLIECTIAPVVPVAPALQVYQFWDGVGDRIAEIDNIYFLI
jgi:hypothetical protein